MLSRVGVWCCVLLVLGACGDDVRIDPMVDAALIEPDALECAADGVALDSLVGRILTVQLPQYAWSARFDAEPESFMHTDCFLRRHPARYAYLRSGICTSVMSYIPNCHTDCEATYQLVWTSPVGGTCNESVAGVVSPCTFSLIGRCD